MTLSELADPLAGYVADFRHRRVLVLGDAILDEYLVGECSRISPEAPVPVLKVNSSRRVLGGAANTAANIVSLGGRATLIALVGADEGGQTLRRCALEAGVDLLAADHGLTTLRKTRVVGQHQQIVRLDYEDIQSPGPALELEILKLFEASVGACDIVVISDYAKGFLSLSLAQAIIRAHEVSLAVIVDPSSESNAIEAATTQLERVARLAAADADPAEAVAGVAGRSPWSSAPTSC